MFRRRRRRISGSGSENPFVVMNLSLFIMLLAFFIVLNAISSFVEQKSEPVVRSVTTAFSTKVLTPDEAPSVAPDERQSIHEGQTIERIDALFNAQITSYDTVKNESAGTMEVTLPLDVFAGAVMAIGQEELVAGSPDKQVKGKRFFLPTLVSVLKSDQQGVPYRMDIVMHSRDNPAFVQNRDPQALAQVMARGAQLAARLETTGLPEKLLSIGMAQGDPDTVRILFRPHIPFTPLEAPDGQ